MATFEATPKYCLTFGAKKWVDYKQASDGAGLRAIMKALRDPKRKRRISFVVVYRNNRKIYHCFKGERGAREMADWGLCYE